MGWLWSGAVLMAGAHFFSMLLPARRDALKNVLGEMPWKVAYSVVVLAGLALMIKGLLAARAGPLAADILYLPPDWTRHLTMLLVLAGFIAVAASHGLGYLKRWLRNPMSVGIGLWAFGHLLANGKKADVIFFGTFLAVALADIALSTWRGKRPFHEPRPRSDAIAVTVGVALYLAFLFGFHPYVLNLPLVP